MYKRIIYPFFLLVLVSTFKAQSNPIFSLTRPFGGGNLQLVEFDLVAGTETVIKTYLPSELFDYNSGATSFDYQNGRFETIGYDSLGNEELIAIDASTGNIAYSYTAINVEVFSLEYHSNGKTYSITRPIGGGNLQLVEFDLVAGTDTVIKTYLPSELFDYNYEATSFDYQNSRFLTIAYDSLGNEELIAIDASTGNIAYSYTAINVEVFSLEYHSNGKAYSITRPIGGGSLQLMEFDLVAGTETVIKTYLPSELFDYSPEAISFDHSYDRIITIGFDSSYNESLIAISTNNGSITHTYTSPSVEVFSLESGGAMFMGIPTKEIEEAEFEIYPNPVSSWINIDANIEYEKIEVIGFAGETIISENNQTLAIDVSNLPKGIYLIGLLGNSTWKFQSFVKQ